MQSEPVLCLYGGQKDDPFRGRWLPAPEKRIRVLNFSGGKQSSALLWMVLRGELEPPDVVHTANPGMEAKASLEYVRMMQARCRVQNIEAYTVPGPNLYEDILNLVKSGKTRFDNPAFYTKNENGKEGKLSQRCTKEYKIAPMNRAVRIALEERLGISRKSSHLPRGVVEKWIGFSASEVHRIKPAEQRWACMRFPLVDMGYTNEKVIGYFLKHDLPMPPRSVCNGCFANDLEYFKDMHDHRPGDWAQALAVDEAIRDWKSIGVNQPVYITRCCKPLKELAACGFKLDDATQGKLDLGASCDSGYCMT